MDGKLAGWLARSKMSYQWHKENLEQFKLGNGELRLRYENSIGTDFSKILGGYDEIGEETDTVIAVEGLFDKVNVDTQLELNENPNIKCVFTFGNKFSDGQIQLLRKKKSIKSVILMYDPEATLQNKKYSKSLEKYFDAYVARLTKPNIDPGDASREYLMHTLKNEVYSPIQFHFTSLPTSNLETRRRLKQ
jgi:5S rRNA maturation endonuclease (ribonuclease M5)